MNPLVLTLLLLAVTAVWGWGFTLAKDAVAVYGVIAFLTMRFVLGWASLRLLTPRPIPRMAWIYGAGLGVLLAAAHLFMTFALRYTTATNTGLITGLCVVVGPLVSRLLFGVRAHRVAWIAIGISMLGLTLLTGVGPSPFNLGDLFTLAGAVCFGFHLSLLDRFAKHHAAKDLALAQLGTTAVMLLPVWALTEPLALPTSAVVWWAIAITGILGTGLGFYVQTLAQQRLPVVHIAVILSMEPAFGALFGFLLAGDRLQGVQLLGGVLMIGAVILAEVGPALYKTNEDDDPSR